MKKYQQYGTFADLPKSGRPKKLTSQIRRSIIRTIIKDPFVTSTEIKSLLPLDSNISVQTIRRELVNEGYRAYKAKKKPVLTAKHIQQRLSYAKKILRFDESEINSIIFSDETRISLMSSDRPPLVRRPKNTSV